MMKQFILTAAAFLCMAGPTANADDGADWPDIPLLSITTEDGAFPTCEIVYPPEGCVGTGIEAEYVKGRLVMTLRKDTLYDSGEYVKDESGMRVKIRGNSTGASEGQKPYKIKLSKKFDMLCRGDEDYKEKDWNLLKISTWNPGFDGAESNFLTALGFIVSKAVGMEWTPGYKFVNLVMNDKYMGMYYLTDAVGRGDKRVDIKKSGYLIENDAYWWKEDAYFKTGKQAVMFGYTFKYPDSDDVDEPTTLNIQNYLNEFEEVLSDENGDVAEYIDLPMFARWIIAHDVLNSADEAGTNMYVYKNDFDEADPTSSKLKMGPLWDFDSAFKNPDDAGKWSKLHKSSYFYYAELFKHEDFRKAYTDAWAEIKPGLLDNVKAGQVTHAVRTTNVNGFSITEGDIIGLDDKKILAKSNSIDETVLSLLEKLKEDQHEVITLYYGEGVTEEDAKALSEKVQEAFPDCDVDYHFGGQPVYYYLLSLE